ncbi:MAG: UTP--glucose-1-phosphate uridylyltransferase [Alphaproteobacteria bacterium]|nr:MAG: UTP--glucose-1-phosphate uridylyltransferase [Alphaproteobacteria bacterium]
MRTVRTAVLPVAGLGTRMLPATKVVPKELLPIGTRPLIQHAVDECWEAGIERVVLVTSAGKHLIVDHFDRAEQLERMLEERGKREALERIATARPPESGRLLSVRQPEPLGLGHAIWCARHIIGPDPFAVLLPDDFILAQPGCLKQMVAAWRELGGNLVATMEVPAEQTGRYGIIEPGRRDGRLIAVKGLVEKPDPARAPSTWAVIGRYILDPAVLRELDAGRRGAGGEIQLTDAMAGLIGRQSFHAYLFEGERFDCGQRAGYIEAQLAVGLSDPEIAPLLHRRVTRGRD